MKQLILETIPKPMKNKNVTWNSHNGFTKRKSCLTNLIALVTALVDEKRAVSVVPFDFSEDFDTLPFRG